MRSWTGVGLGVALVALVGALTVAVVATRDSDEHADDLNPDAELDAGERLTREVSDPSSLRTIIAGVYATPDGGIVDQSGSGSDEAPSAESFRAEQDDDPSLPGIFFDTQGRRHFQNGYHGHAMTPFCNGVPHSVRSDPEIEIQTVGPVNRCYLTNPPSSGTHLGVQRNVDIGGGIVINIPPDPDVYPHDVEIPRDAIPHILEHAGVFVGYHCAEGDVGCEALVAEIEDLVNQRIDEFDDRVVLARDTDLPVGEIGVAAWTRVLNARWDEVELDEIEEFISVHSCRFDPEGFC